MPLSATPPQSCFGVGHKVGHRNAQRSCESMEIQQGNVAFASLDIAEVSPMDPRNLGQLLLAHRSIAMGTAHRQPPFPDGRPKRSQQFSTVFHGRDARNARPIGLQTKSGAGR